MRPRGEEFGQIVTETEGNRSGIILSTEIADPGLLGMRIDHIRILVIVTCVTLNLERRIVKCFRRRTTVLVGIRMAAWRNEWLGPIKLVLVLPTVEEDDFARLTVESNRAEKRKFRI